MNLPREFPHAGTGNAEERPLSQVYWQAAEKLAKSRFLTAKAIRNDKNKGLSGTSKLMPSSNTFQTRVFPQPLEIRRVGTPVLHQLARENKKLERPGRQHRFRCFGQSSAVVCMWNHSRRIC